MLALLKKSKLDTLTLRERNGGRLAVTNDEHIAETSGEGVTLGVLNVSNIERAHMLLDRLEDANTTDIVSAGKHDGGAVRELDDGGDLTGGELDLDGVVQADIGVGEADGAAIVGGDVRDLVLVDRLADNLAELELGLVGLDAVSLETALGVVEDAEVLLGALDGDNITDAKREARVLADLAVDLESQ